MFYEFEQAVVLVRARLVDNLHPGSSDPPPSRKRFVRSSERLDAHLSDVGDPSKLICSVVLDLGILFRTSTVALIDNVGSAVVAPTEEQSRP
ncbi:hypothetical protein [Rathayibacter sp. AY1D9]|uniref:hypothetical protein n=1 Tax=Rathayibacter sp. AY1D9 TaxID=2080548 RepID=UPI0011B0B6B3|nr:hypothetical protein [Rathayibacter sp. AY1D9]